MVWNASLEDDEGKEMTGINPKCPSCKSASTCEIVYGYPSDIEEYLKLVSEKKISAGGCCHDENSPIWHCNDCQYDWPKHKDLDEVYDQ